MSRVHTRHQRRGRYGASRCGFTIIELAVAVVVLGLMLSVLLPVVSRGRQAAFSAECLNNLKTLGQDTALYTYAYSGFYPPASTTDTCGITVSWDGAMRIHAKNNLPDDLFAAGAQWERFDLTTVTRERADDRDTSFGSGAGDDQNGGKNADRLRSRDATPFIPPLMTFAGERTGAGVTMDAMPHCPVYRPHEESAYTGYNYNTDYIGRGPTLENRLHNPSATAIYGDGVTETADGVALPNKFMRAPTARPLADSIEAEDPCSGTQGYRHLEGSNVLWGDLHASTHRERHEQTAMNSFTAGDTTGWLSEDDTLYDLK